MQYSKWAAITTVIDESTAIQSENVSKSILTFFSDVFVLHSIPPTEPPFTSKLWFFDEKNARRRLPLYLTLHELYHSILTRLDKQTNKMPNVPFILYIFCNFNPNEKQLTYW